LNPEDSKIEERESRTAVNLNSESKENQANARLRNAQAKKLESESDMTDLNFMRKYDGVDREEEIENKEVDFLSKSRDSEKKMEHDKELAGLRAELDAARLELDGLKNRRETKEKAQEAIREIRKHQKNKNVSFNTSKVDNLPDDFNKKSPDNMILSVALQYKRRNPILLTNDKGLQIKAEMLDIPAKTIMELTSLLSLSRRSFANRKNTKRKKQ